MYLTVPPTAARLDEYKRIGLGVMHTPMMGNRCGHGLVWAADTGCYTQPKKFNLDRYYGWLDGQPRSSCLFATAPDVVGDPVATWERSEAVLPVIRSLGYRAALVAQDGMTDVPWDAFDCFFVGGSTEWKLSEAAYRLVEEAKSRGKWCHMGRVNSWRRFKAAAAAGYDSADGTFVGFGPEKNLPQVASWLDWAGSQPTLWATHNDGDAQ